jgi:hypothetical protein
MDPKTQGIWCRKDKIFYYLETGGITPNSVDKVRSSLISLGKITYYKDDPNDREPTYKIITLQEAQENEYEIKALNLTQNIKNSALKREDIIPENPWD